MEDKKISIDPQENEIDSNIFKKPFRALAGSTDDETDKTEEEKKNEPKTLDEEQDPANH